MHQKRNTVSRKVPLPRKGTKFVAIASSHKSDSVPTVIAIRDMLGLAKNLSEVKKMIHRKLLKINGKPIKDYRESIRLFNILEADSNYVLKILPTKKFFFEKISDKDSNKRLCKIVNKKLLSGNKIQLNFHDGSNALSQDKKISVNDSVYVSFDGKIASNIPLEKSSKVFIFSGKYSGLEGTVSSVKDSMVELKLKEKEDLVSLNKNQVMAL